MARWFVVTVLSIIASAPMTGCDDSSSPPPPPTTYTPASQPWSTRPPGAEEFLASTRGSATTTSATTRSATTTTTRRLRADAPDEPGAFIEAMFRSLREGKLETVRDMVYEPMASHEVQAVFGRSINGFQRGATVTVIDKKQIGDAALVIVRSAGPVADDNDTSYMLMLRRFERWRVLLDEPNLRRLTGEEKKNLLDVMEWGTTRLQQLRAPATQAAVTQPSTPAPAPATPPPPPATPTPPPPAPQPVAIPPPPQP